MSLKLVMQIWTGIKPLLATSDRPEAAELFVNSLIEHDYDPKEIKKVFKKDGNIVNALGFYEVDEIDEEDDPEELDFSDYDDYEDDDDY
jgi:hypothetical protein